MKYVACALLFVAAVVALAEPVSAQPCPHPFTANPQSSSSYIQYCVMDNGNITSITTPFSVPLIGSFGEGYGICQESPIAEYHDYFSDASANWNAAQVLSVSGSSIKIARSTADGNWTLVQTISKVGATGSIKIVMALTNNQAVAKVAYLLRYANSFRPDEGMRGGASLNSAWTWTIEQGTPHYGLELANAAKSPFSYRQGFISPSFLPNTCDFAAATAPSGETPLFTNHHFFMWYVYAGTVPAHGTRTVTLNYRSK
jgi:hypothetical protein